MIANSNDVPKLIKIEQLLKRNNCEHDSFSGGLTEVFGLEITI